MWQFFCMFLCGRVTQYSRRLLQVSDCMTTGLCMFDKWGPLFFWKEGNFHVRETFQSSLKVHFLNKKIHYAALKFIGKIWLASLQPTHSSLQWKLFEPWRETCSQPMPIFCTVIPLFLFRPFPPNYLVINTKVPFPLPLIYTSKAVKSIVGTVSI